MKEIELEGKFGTWEVIELNGSWYRWCGSKPGGIYLFQETYIELRNKKEVVVIVGIKPPEEGENIIHEGITYQVLSERIGSWKFIFDVELIREKQLELF